MTLRQAKDCGVWGESSFTMDDVIVEQCTHSGVYAHDTSGVGRCTNVVVRQCGESGVVANDGGSITLIGAKTTVHYNCTKGESGEYGLKVEDSSSTIQLISPLTKETVSIDNAGGGNWGAGEDAHLHRIKTIADTSSHVSVVASGETKTTSTSSTKQARQGTYTFADGGKYVGDSQDNKPHGNGIYTWASGDKCFGAWKDGKMYGWQGTRTSASKETELKLEEKKQQKHAVVERKLISELDAEEKQQTSTSSPAHKHDSHNSTRLCDGVDTENFQSFADQTNMARPLPEALWRDMIIPKLCLKEITTLGVASSMLQNLSSYFIAKNYIIRIPEDVSINEAMLVCEKRTKKRSYTLTDPQYVMLNEGTMDISRLIINQCSNVTFLGKGADKTLISGGVDISDQKNIVFKGIHVNNGVTVSGKETSGFFSGCFFSGCALDGLSVDDFASVTATQCHFFDNEWSGADLNNHSKGAFTNCTFYENGRDEGAGVAARCGAVVNIYGRNTAIYSNPGDGIFAQANAVVDIYLPFEHNTVHDNGRKGYSRDYHSDHITVYEQDTHVYENGREGGKIRKPREGQGFIVIENTPEVECSDEFVY
jgi:hypothetical protein